MQVTDSLGRNGGREVLGSNRAHDFDSTACSGDRDVEAALPSCPVNRPEVHGELAVLIAAVADAEDHHVSLVSLNVLEVLDEVPVEASFMKKIVQIRTFQTPPVQLDLDRGGLR